MTSLRSCAEDICLLFDVAARPRYVRLAVALAGSSLPCAAANVADLLMLEGGQEDQALVSLPHKPVDHIDLHAHHAAGPASNTAGWVGHV